MNGQIGLMLGCASLVVALRLFWLARSLWNYPLKHGPGYFLGVAVGPEFHTGPGIRWLKQYRVLLLVQHSILVASFLTFVFLRQWNRLPFIATIDVSTSFLLIGGFLLWVRYKFGANPPRMTRVSVSLEPRRLRHQVSWPMEALILVLVAASWALLGTAGDAAFSWQMPVLSTYLIVGLLPAEIIIARGSYPLPADRTAEHHEWMKRHRKRSRRIVQCLRWFVVVVFLGYAVRHGLPAANNTVPWLPWPFIAVAVLIYVVMMVFVTRTMLSTGRDLRPAGSWAGPFQPPRVMMRGGLLWSILYCGGLAALLLLFRS